MMTTDPTAFFEERSDRYATLRRDIHKHPETAFEETRTSAIVADALKRYGYEVHSGLAKTGVVGVLKAGDSDRAIGLRADMDALHIHEANDFEHRSVNAGKMHACGHDGHTAMLLAAAEYLAAHKPFDGVLYLIFQPAEENEGGAQVMVNEGLFDRFPMDAVFGMHNAPSLPLGSFAVRPGPMLAGFDRFKIRITGVGGHAAMPEACTDPVIVAAHLVTALQTIVSRNLDPLSSSVVSVTRITAGEAFNVIPQYAELSGAVRYFDKTVQEKIEEAIARLSAHVAQAFGAESDVVYMPGYPPLVNAPEETAACIDVLSETFGADKVNGSVNPAMGSEDFAFMLKEKAGCYIFAGGFEDGAPATMVHHPKYDFNDGLIPLGALYWVKLAEKFLPRTD